MTCTDARDRNKIMTAFANGLMLASQASSSLDKLRKALPDQANVRDKTSNTVTANLRFIADEDPAYTQMFFALDGRIVNVKDSFDTVTSMVAKVPGDRDNKGTGGLRFICDKAGKVLDAAGESYCA